MSWVCWFHRGERGGHFQQSEKTTDMVQTKGFFLKRFRSWNEFERLEESRSSLVGMGAWRNSKSIREQLISFFKSMEEPYAGNLLFLKGTSSTRCRLPATAWLLYASAGLRARINALTNLPSTSSRSTSLSAAKEVLAPFSAISCRP